LLCVPDERTDSKKTCTSASAYRNQDGVEHERSCHGALEVAAAFESAAGKLARLLRGPCAIIALAAERGARAARRREELRGASLQQELHVAGGGSKDARPTVAIGLAGGESCALYSLVGLVQEVRWEVWPVWIPGARCHRRPGRVGRPGWGSWSVVWWPGGDLELILEPRSEK
jgi:hypothetical protein